MQDTNTLKVKIIALLDFLPADSLKLLAEFATFLGSRSGSGAADISVSNPESNLIIRETRHQPLRVSSPHLVRNDQVSDFKLEVIEETS